MIYFDNAASTPLSSEVLEFLKASLAEDFANPSAAHSLGKSLTKKIEQSRFHFLEFLNAVEEFDFFFTSSATESNNTIIKGLNFNSSDEVYYSKGDHPSLVNTIENSNKSLSSNFTDKTKLALLTHVNSQSGEVQDVLTQAKEIKEKNSDCWVHVDGVQAFGKIVIDLNKSPIDSYSISSHKIRGPKGIAGLYLRKNKNCMPLLDGGGQENGFRSSTQSPSLIFAFELAASIAFESMSENTEQIILLSNYFSKEIKKIVPNVIFPFPNASPYILSFVIPKLPSDVILRHLEQDKIFISSSSACSSKIKGKNPTFTALGIEEQFHKNVFRVSFGPQNDLEEVKQFFESFKKHYESLRYLLK